MCIVWPYHSFVDGLSLKCINVHRRKKKEVKLINDDFPPILMLLYIMLHILLAYLMLFASLSNAVCLYNAFFLFFFAIDFCKCFFMLCLGLLTHSLFISCIILHHAQCF